MNENSTMIVMAVGCAITVPAVVIIFTIVHFLEDFHPPAPAPRQRAARITHNTINIHIHGDLVVQVGDGERRALPARQVQALLSDAGSTQTVRIVDPETRQFEEYRRGRLVRRGELIQMSTSIVKREG